MTLPPGFIRSPLMAAHGIWAVFSSRHGGVSSPPFASLNLADDLGDDALCVQTNIRRFCQLSGLPRPHTCKQVHGTDILHCRGTGYHHGEKADALLSHEAACALAVRTADCIPVLLAHPPSGTIAAVHAGWRGTAAGIVAHCCQRMLTHGGTADDILASIGPGIGVCCFAVQEDVARLLTASVHDMASSSLAGHADLQAINAGQLRQCGVRHIEIHRHCTACEVNNYFSWRRENGQTGRQWAVICR